MPGHHLHERVEDLGDGEDLLLADAEQVVVERAAGDDRSGRVLEAGGRVDDDRGIARPGDDRPLLARQGGPRDGRPARDHQEPHRLVVEQRRGRLERGRVDDREQVVDADRLADRLVEPPHALGRDPRPGGMGVEDDRVARGQHVDRVAGQRRQAVRHRRDRADDAERDVVGQRQAVVARVVVGAEVLDSRDTRRWRCWSLAILWSSRPILVSSSSSRPSSSAWSTQILRMQSTAFVRSASGRVWNAWNAASAAVTASSTVEKTPRLPDGRDGALPLASDGPVAHLGQDLLDHVADEIFGHLHGGHRCSLKDGSVRFESSLGTDS